MSYGASIYSHVYYPPIAAEVLCGISSEQGLRPGTIVKSAPSQLEIETQLVVDRLLRESHTQIAPWHRPNRYPYTHPRPPGGGQNFTEATTPGQLTLVSVTASGILVVGFACALMAHWVRIFPATRQHEPAGFCRRAARAKRLAPTATFRWNTPPEPRHFPSTRRPP